MTAIALCASTAAATTIAALIAPPALASGPVWHLESQQTPAAIALTAGVDEVEVVKVSGENNNFEGATPNLGKFALELEDRAGEAGETKTLAYTASAAELQVALEAITEIGSGNVQVAGGPEHAGGNGQDGWSYVITFVGARGGRQLGELVVDEVSPTSAEKRKVKEEKAEPAVGEATALLTTEGAGDLVEYTLLAKNVGTAASAGPITLEDTLPAGVSTLETREGKGWECAPLGEGANAVTCASESAVQPGAQTTPVVIVALVNSALIKEGELLTNKATVSGGGASASEATNSGAADAGVSALTEAASAISATSATLNATVDPHGREVTECEFEYGPGKTYPSSVPCSPARPSGSGQVAVSARLSGLVTHTAYRFRVIVTSAAGITSGGGGTFTTYQVPRLKRVTPKFGSPAGGTSVTITGTHFGGATQVMFGSTAATSFKVNSPGTIVAVSPPGTGRASVTVTTPGGTTAASTKGRFTYRFGE